jgi:DNA invertase Pin-like site-specific DNA recombinase
MVTVCISRTSPLKNLSTHTANAALSGLFEAINGMLLDMLAAVARKDYVDRRRRQALGQAKAKAEGRYKGRPEDAERNDGIARMLAAGQSWGSIQSATGCSRGAYGVVGAEISDGLQATAALSSSFFLCECI